MDGQPPASDNIVILLIAAACCVVLSMMFSASESAFLGINRLRVHFLREKGDKKATRVGKLLDHKEELLNTLLIANELVNVALSVILTSIALKLFGPAGLTVSTLTATILLLLFGEITPKIITTRVPEAASFALSGFVSFVFHILKPIVAFFTFISRSILKMIHIDMKFRSVSFTEDEIKTFIDVGNEQGVLENAEKKMMTRVFKFTDLEAQDIMVPRLKIISIHPNMSFRDILQLSERTRLKRFPVIREDIDDIIGILYVKDMLFYDGPLSEFSVEKIMRKPLFIPGGTRMASIQDFFHKERQTIAIVIDEYSGTDGIITVEDIMREIFGAVIEDFERDSLPTDFDIDLENKKDMTLAGSTRLSDLEEALHQKFESQGNETLAGFLCEKLGHIPAEGESVKANGYIFRIEKMEGLRIASVHAVKHKGGEA